MIQTRVYETTLYKLVKNDRYYKIYDNPLQQYYVEISPIRPITHEYFEKRLIQPIFSFWIPLNYKDIGVGDKVLRRGIWFPPPSPSVCLADCVPNSFVSTCFSPLWIYMRLLELLGPALTEAPRFNLKNSQRRK